MWTYGLAKHDDDGGHVYELVELYGWGDDGNRPVQGYCTPFLMSSSVEGLKKILNRMLESLDDPKIIDAITPEVDDDVL